MVYHKLLNKQPVSVSENRDSILISLLAIYILAWYIFVTDDR